MKIVALDIETSPIKGYVWQLWQQNLGLDQIIDPGKILCWAAKDITEKKITQRRHDDHDFLSAVHKILDEADAVLTYNGRRFDLPWLNTEFVRAGMKPPSPYKHLDLLETAKKQFKFPSNKMQFLLTDLKLGEKMEHEGFPMWVKCLANDKVAWGEMLKYNRQDVTELIKLYYRLQPWIDSHPNHSLFSQETVCPNCGSKHLQSRGYYYTSVGMYRKMQCQDCGKWSRTRYTEVDKDVRKSIIVGAV